MLGFYGLMLLPNIVAGYALLKALGEDCAIIGGVTAAMSFPIGTQLRLHILVLFSEPGKSLSTVLVMPSADQLAGPSTQHSRNREAICSTNDSARLALNLEQQIL